MKTVSIFSLLAAFTSMAVALPADPTLFAEVNSWVNATGITQSTTPNDFTKTGARGIELVAPSLPSEFKDFALNATIATEDSAGSVELLAPGDIFINCTVATNSAGEPNWIWINYNDTGASFYAYGDAGAAFAVVPSTSAAVLTSAVNTSTSTTTTGGKKRDTTTVAATPAATVNLTTTAPATLTSPTVVNVTSIVYTDQGSVLNPTAIINPHCPPAPATVSAVLAPTTNTSTSTTTTTGTHRRSEFYGRSRF